MNRSEKFNFYLPQNIDPIDVSNFDYNFEIIDENLITEEQSLSSTQKANARANLDLGDAALQTVANNLTTSSAGSVLDARQGKALGGRTTANESAVSSIRNSMAIVSAGNTHSAITAGQYVYVHSHSSLNEGLYTANSNISANATLSTSNLTAVSGGGLNALNSKINDKLDYYTLLNGETVTSTLTNKTLFGSRSISNYKLLLAVVKRGGVLRVSLITVRGLFSENTAVMSLTEVDSTNTQRWYEIKYVNDTKVSIQCSSNASGNADIYLYGLH